MCSTWVNLSKMGVVAGSLDQISRIEYNFTHPKVGLGATFAACFRKNGNTKQQQKLTLNCTYHEHE